ncbi:hypothetical protein [Streptomyces spectabilis]|uniref:Uncharacterized protein n=1 Tax=Streptomyces spectabilis TaxID=68270 RepID=A0A516R1K8_STRST|nr:hypothetical protein [Streptomyces spectabilis]QDQ09547.1 hypothetical protein FH965_02380 [Streptomyces spectabilis]
MRAGLRAGRAARVAVWADPGVFGGVELGRRPGDRHGTDGRPSSTTLTPGSSVVRTEDEQPCVRLEPR